MPCAGRADAHSANLAINYEEMPGGVKAPFWLDSAKNPSIDKFF